MIVMVLFLVILYTVHSQQKEAEYAVQTLDGKHAAERLAQGINDVYLAGWGATKNVTLPEEIRGGKTYTLRVYPRSVVVNYSSREGDRFYSHRILTSDVNGSGLNPGKVRISNTNGTIYVENV